METSDTLEEENLGDIYVGASDKQDTEYMQKVSVAIGSLSIVFSLVFIWNAVELGIVLACGRKLEDSCLCEKVVKEELRTILQEKV